MLNALSFDIEDYFQVAALSAAVSRSSWESVPRRVDGNTQLLLDTLAPSNTRATFFFLGWVAEREPQLVRRVVAAGHEVACHGYSHRLVYEQSPAEFREETLRSKALLEDQAQVPVLGYRAASYSITRRSLWALDTLVEAGFVYDSSIFPVRHDIYGIPEAPRAPHLIQRAGGGLVEFPPSTAQLPGVRLPVAGGGYFRIFPYGVTRWAVRRVNAEGLPFIFYLHPWEVDPGQPRVRANWLSRFRHYTNLARCEARLKKLLVEFQFAPAREVLEAHGWIRDGQVAVRDDAAAPSDAYLQDTRDYVRTRGNTPGLAGSDAGPAHAATHGVGHPAPRP
ncbi:MAG: XrtA system polysaccharide deacetylase [Steroidobacteraceae bacterium]